MKQLILVLQTIFAVSTIVLILVQSKGTGLGKVFGGSGEAYSTRRGVEKAVFYLTVLVASLFFVLSAVRLFI